MVSSAGVAVATLVSNAWLKRGDRKRERTLDRERRVWEAKSAALITVIANCSTLHAACQQDWSLPDDDAAMTTVRSRIAVLKQRFILAHTRTH